MPMRLLYPAFVCIVGTLLLAGSPTSASTDDVTHAELNDAGKLLVASTLDGIVLTPGYIAMSNSSDPLPRDAKGNSFIETPIEAPSAFDKTIVIPRNLVALNSAVIVALIPDVVIAD